MKKHQTMKILYIASEAAPIIKIGGLGDVAGSLPKALKNLSLNKISGYDLDIRVAIPFHASINQKFDNLQLVASFFVKHQQGDIPARVFQTNLDGITVYLIEGGSILTDENVYSSNPEYDAKKFIFFSIAALDFVKKINWKVDIVHANDWHTALAAYDLQLRQQTDNFFKSTKSVLSMHNMPYMGTSSEDIFQKFGLPNCPCTMLPEWARNIPLPMGMYAADYLLTVSPNYAKEILTPDYGCGLQDFLSIRKNTLAGILNGLDETKWDPENDPTIHHNFGLDQLNQRVNNKLALQTEFGLEKSDEIPLFIMITRLDQQKGVDLAISALRMLTNHSWQAILLGTGDPVIESACRSLEVEMPEKVRSIIRFDQNLSKRMYSGGDIILIPSRYEPCGLTQMIAMRFGCVPLARATGGLKDTIFDEDNLNTKNGYLFSDPTPESMAQTMIQALTQFKNKKQWHQIQMNGMKSNFSWEKSAIEYAKIYKKLIEENHEN
ncbi:MAG TPA: glycogen synthase [Anaerolineaceae bacterium]|nr:glycogen synthase [Anaerolineaceae bacterium]